MIELKRKGGIRTGHVAQNRKAAAVVLAAVDLVGNSFSFYLSVFCRMGTAATARRGAALSALPSAGIAAGNTFHFRLGPVF